MNSFLGECDFKGENINNMFKLDNMFISLPCVNVMMISQNIRFKAVFSHSERILQLLWVANPLGLKCPQNDVI